MKLAKEIWDKHVEMFQSFDLVCHNGSSLEDETLSNSLFNALITLEYMKNDDNKEKVESAIEYLKTSKYYSCYNKDSKH